MIDLFDDEEESLEDAVTLEAANATGSSVGMPLTDEEKVREVIRRRAMGLDNELAQSLSESRDRRLAAQVARGAGQIAAGLTGANNFDASGFDALEREADNPVKDVIARRTSQDKALGLLQADQKAKEDREFKLKQLGIMNESRLDMANARARAAAEKEKEKRDLKREQETEKDIQKLGDTLGNSQDIANALGVVEKELGFRLDDAENRGGKLVVRGKEKDLPGVSLPGVGRVGFYSNAAQNLQSAVARVFNTELKDRSGAAVTTPELERLKTEFGSGKFNTEAQLVGAMKEYKRLASQALKNREARFRPEIVDAYRQRGGQTSQDFSSAAPVRSVTRKQFSPSRNQTKITYSDGSEEIVDGRK